LETLIDMKALLDCFGNDKNFVAELLDDYYKSTRGHLSALREAAAAKDMKKVADTAHALKGISASMFLEPLRDSFLQLEQMGKRGDLTGNEEVLKKIDVLFSEFEKEFHLTYPSLP